MVNLNKKYSGKRILITGGLGFIGSTLAKKLNKLNAEITLIDSRLKNHGANEFNISQIKKDISLKILDIRNKKKISNIVKEKDIIFDFAAYINPSQKNNDIELETTINNQGHLNILEACKKNNLKCRIVFPSSRTVYGSVKKTDLPVSESHSLNPTSTYSSNKIAVENYLGVYNKHYGLDTLALRIANPFGPGAQIKHPGYCIVNWFVRQALENKEINIFGKGNQLRDYIFIEDVADAFAIAGVHKNTKNRIYNVGSGTGTQFKTMVEKIINEIGKGKIKNIPWPENYKKTETGDFYADISQINKDFGWKPKTNLEEGLKKTIEFYRENLNRYI